MRATAAALGLEIVTHPNRLQLPGVMFASDRFVTRFEVVRGAEASPARAGLDDSPGYVEYGNARWGVLGPLAPPSQRFGYLAVELPRPVPHVVLDPAGGERPGIARENLLHLEGDVPSTFETFAARGRERESLQVLAPDVVAALLDHASEATVELVDRWLLLRWSRTLDLAQPSTHARMATIVTEVGRRVRRAAAGLSVETPAPGEVAPRLHLGLTVGAVLAAFVVAALLAWPIVAALVP